MKNILREPKIINKKPLFWFLVRLFYPKAVWGRTHFAFGDTIYSPNPLSEDVVIHESVHLEQHHYSKLFACYVFIRFWLSKSYRLKLEVPAYITQWKWIKDNYKHQNRLDNLRFSLAKSMSSDLYGPMISYQEAINLLTWN